MIPQEYIPTAPSNLQSVYSQDYSYLPYPDWDWRALCHRFLGNLLGESRIHKSQC